jgi:hypothetical protein
MSKKDNTEDKNQKILLLEESIKSLSKQEEAAKTINPADVIAGSVFDIKSFNLKVDKYSEILRKRRKLKDQIQLEKLKHKPFDYGDITYNQFRYGLISDFYNMISEIKNMSSFSFNQLSIIINKGYRKLMILVILLIILLLFLILYK